MKVLHILDHYKPHFSGYVFRTSYILKHQKDLGIDPVLLTSPKHGEVKDEWETTDSMPVYHTSNHSFGSMPFIREVRLMRTLKGRIDEVINKERPDIIHAHSPSLNGIPALVAARKSGVPVVYEVRAFWEDAAVDHGSFGERSFQYKMSRFIETALLKRMDAVFTICDGLRKEMMKRGIPGKKITIIRNCVDAELFTPMPYDVELAESYRLRGKSVFGFIGSFYHYEGLDLLVESFGKAFRDDNHARLLLVGDGPEGERLRRKVEVSGLSGQVIMTGRIPHEQISRYYSVMDVLVYPRIKMRLTESVTPLKPLEAMALGKVVVGSDVGGIKELIGHEREGLLFEAGKVDSLCAVLRDLSRHNGKCSELARNARERVRKEYSWPLAVEKYMPIYTRLTAKGEEGAVRR